MASFCGRAAQFLRRREGSIGIMFGLVCATLIAAVGLGIDYGQVSLAQTRLQEAADSAVLAEVSAQNISTTTGSAQASALEQAAVAKFQALAAQDHISISSASAEVVPNTQSITLTYAGSVPATFGQIVGLHTYAVAGTSSATTAAPQYIDIYLLVDVSGSMGVGATAADQLLMNDDKNLADGLPTKGGCMFGCHADGTDAVARQDGATLRIDVVQKALQQIVAAAQNVGTGTTLQLALITYGDNLTVNAPLTSNLTTISDAVNALELAGDNAGTSTEYALNYVKNMIPAAGDGSSAASPLVYVILATDGTSDSIDNPGGIKGSWTQWSQNFYPPYTGLSEGPPFPYGTPYTAFELEGLDPTWCQGLKSAGVNVMTLEMPYVVPTAATVGLTGDYEPTDLRIEYIESTLLPIIPSQMTACASQPSYHISASAPADIMAAMQTLFTDTVTGTPRLTK